MKHLIRGLTVALGVLACGAGFAGREKPLYDSTFFEPSEEVVTSHLPWLKPAAFAPPRVLFITHRNAMREVVELAQRLDMQYKVFACEKTNQFGETGIGVDCSWKLIQGNSAEELTERLRKDLAADWDVIVLGNINWSILPLDCRYEILKKVKAGTGLVGAIPKDGRDVFLDKIMSKSEFCWNWAVWSGGVKDIPDYFGIGVFDGAVDYTTGHTGTASLRIVGKEVKKGSKESPRSGYHPGAINLEPNTEYQFSMWTKTQGLETGGAGVSLHPQPKGVPVPASADWTYTETPFTTNDKQLTTGVYLLNYQVGTVWYDDVRLVKRGDDRNLLPNPSFEFPGPAPEQLADGLPWKSLPAFAKQPDTAAFLRSTFGTAKLGAGRIGLVNVGVPRHQMLTPGPVGRVQDQELDYDYYLAAAIKLILWAAKREQAVAVACSAGPAIAAEATTPAKVAFQLRAAKPEGKAAMELQVRNRRNRVWHLDDRTLDVPQGDTVAEFALPKLPNGSYFADLWVRRDGKVLGVGSVGIEVTAKTRIANLTLAQPSFGSGEPLKGQVTVENPLPDLSVRLRATDLQGRVVARGSAPVANGTADFTVPTLPALTLVGWLEAELVQGADTLDVRTLDYTVGNRYPDPLDMLFVMWDAYPNDFLGPMIAAELGRQGIDSYYGGKHQPGYGIYANQWWLPYATRFTDSKTDWYQLKATREATDLVRAPCLTDPKYREEVRADLLKTAEGARNCSTAEFTLGDENLFVSGRFDLCMSETCVADFRVWAQTEYGSIDALNASWGSSFKAWDEVKPGTLEDCQKTGNLVPWVDHRLHMESVWAGMHAFSRDVIRSVVPQARVGYEGSDSHVSTWLAADFWKLAHSMNLNNIYYRDFLSLAWSDFVEPGTLLGAGWFGGYANNRNEPFMRCFPWRALFKGSNSLWVWAGFGHAGSVMSFDTSLYPFFKAACEEVREIKSGPAKLLITSKREHDGIALLYSPSSVHLATATQGFPDMDKILNATVKVLHDIGLEARVLAYAELAAGKLQNSEFKVLILPCSQALGPDEVVNIRRFVEAGGCVIADLRPGITDLHGKPYAKPALDDLFGVTQAAAFKKEIGASDTLGLKGIACDASLTAAGGQAGATSGNVPLLIANRCGQGQALLLNFALDGYLAESSKAGVEFAGWAEGEPYRKLLRAEMERQGVRPVVTVQPEAPCVEISRFRDGDAEYVGIVQTLPFDTIEYTNRKLPVPQPRQVTINFGREAQVYDVRAGKHLGKAATVTGDLTPGIAKLYALLPDKPRKPSLRLPNKAQPGERIEGNVEFKSRRTAENHVVRVRVFAPDGKEVSWYAQNLRVTDTPATFQIAFAWNDKPGKWRITATDVVTGVSESETLKLAEK